MSSAMSSDEIKSATAHEVNNIIQKGLISFTAIQNFTVGADLLFPVVH